MTNHNVIKTFQVFYAHPEGGFRLIATVPLAANGEMHTSLWLEELFWRMQGENWSRHGEGREIVENTGVQHTSMSVGDIARNVETGEVWKVANTGWIDVKGAPCWSPEIAS